MQEMFYIDKCGATHAIVEALVANYLEDNNVVLCKKQYYVYCPNTGLWRIKTIEEIQLDVARYYQVNTDCTWHVKYKKEVIEKLKVEISEIDEMDCANKTTVCMLNGVYDLANDTFVEHSPQFYFTSGLQINYNPKSHCTKFRKFLKEISCNRKDRMKSLIEFLGLALTKEVNSQAFIMVGAGRNGKSVFANIACALVGQDRWTAATLKEMPRFGAAVLQDKTLAIISEIDKMTSSSLMINELKQALSGENMQGNLKFKDLFTFRPHASILILSNHEIGLEFDDTDGALRRLHIFPAEYQIKDSDVDTTLEVKLLSELEGIFILAAKGYRELKKHGYLYSSKAESDRLIASMLKRENPIRAFVKERIVFCSKNFVSYENFRQCFMQWCDKEGIDSSTVCCNSTVIKSEISKQYNVKLDKSNGKRGLRNIKIT